MDDNTSIQFRLRLAQINGIKINEEQIDEDFEVGRKVNVTNPKATPRYEITDKDDTHYHLKSPDGKTMKLPKERIHRVNKMNEEQIDEADHHILARVSKDDGKMTQKSVIVTTKNRDAAMVRAERHFRDKGMKVHALKYVRQSDSAPYLPGSSNVREENQMNEEQIDEVKRSADYLHSTATEDQRAPTLKTYHTAMAKYSNLPPRAAHIKALNDTIDKHGVKNANQHVTKHFYSQMQKHLTDED